MASLTQIEAARSLVEEGWTAVSVPFDLEKSRIGGPITMLNASGDVLKVFADGSKIIITSVQWAELLRQSQSVTTSQPIEYRIDYDEVGNLDDVVIPEIKLFRLEYMDDNSIWIRLYREGKPDIIIWLGAQDKINGSHEFDEDLPDDTDSSVVDATTQGEEWCCPCGEKDLIACGQRSAANGVGNCEPAETT